MRFASLLTACLLSAMVAWSLAFAADEPKKLTPEERKDLEAKRLELNGIGLKAYQAGKIDEAQKVFEEALKVARQLYPKEDHPDLAQSMNNFASVLLARQKYAEAETLLKDALEMRKRLFKGDHPDLLTSIRNLGSMFKIQGKDADAEPYFRDALAMQRRLFKGDQPQLVGALVDLAEVCYRQKKYADAEPAAREALEVFKRLVKGDHPQMALLMQNLAFILKGSGKLAEAEPLFRDTLGMLKRLVKGDHPQIAETGNDLGNVLTLQQKYADAEPVYREVLEMRKRLFKGDHPLLAESQRQLADMLRLQGKYPEAKLLYQDALEMQKRLYKGDHPQLALTVNNLGILLGHMEKYAEAEPLLRDCVGMWERLFKEDHPNVPQALNNLGVVIAAQRRHVEAERLYRKALELRQRLYPNQDHHEVAASLQNVGGALHAQGKSAEAEPFTRAGVEMFRRLDPKRTDPNLATSITNFAFALEARGKYAEAEKLHREALEIFRKLHPKQDHPQVAHSLRALSANLHQQKKSDEAVERLREALEMLERLHKGDHPDLAMALNNFGALLLSHGLYSDAEKTTREALAMWRRLFPGDHHDLALSLSNLGVALRALGKYPDAELASREALEMRQRLFKGAHPDVAASLHNLASVLHAREKYKDADKLFRDSMRLSRELAEETARLYPEGEALAFLATRPPAQDFFLTNARAYDSNPVDVYAEVLASKGVIARAYEMRALAARAAATDPAIVRLVSDLVELRRRRAEIILAPSTSDPAAQTTRAGDLKTLDGRIAEIHRVLRPLLPVVERSEQLAKTGPAQIQKHLPTDVVFVDFLAYQFIEHEQMRKPGDKQTPSYLAFVVTKDAVKWLDLGPADKIEKAVNQWRESITTPPFQIPADVPAKVRELVWAKVRKEFPAGTKVVYISPDLALTRVPWSALPGDEPGKIVLEEFAVAVVPHGLFLLDQLQPQEPAKKTPGGLLAVGGIPYDTNPAPPSLFASLARGSRTRGELPIKAGEKLQWSELKYTKGEAEMAARIAQRKKITAELLSGADASTERVLSELPHARFAHFATHGFFADASFRSVLQVDPKLFEISTRGERVGAGALSPMTMCGLVFSGANKAETRGRGLITGDHLIDRDLSGLELAVLSACETGLGDVAGGEGVFGLQRAFHVAGCRNVVASLWKVDDAATAALMNEFYTQLWTENQPPVIALQKAQLAIYRADPKDFGKIATRGIEEGTIDLSNVPVKKYPANPTKGNHPALWAAFTLSGVGR